MHVGRWSSQKPMELERRMKQIKKTRLFEKRVVQMSAGPAPVTSSVGAFSTLKPG